MDDPRTSLAGGHRSEEREAEGAARGGGPSDAERRGLGDIGQFGDPTATGGVGEMVDSSNASGADRFADAGLGDDPPEEPDGQSST